jgi:hypothetical protein
MLKNIKDLSSLIKIDNQLDGQKKDLIDIIFETLRIIKNESGVVLQEKNILIKKNILKIKSDSNNRFIIFLHIKKINKNLKDLNSGFILEL